MKAVGGRGRGRGRGPGRHPEAAGGAEHPADNRDGFLAQLVEAKDLILALIQGYAEGELYHTPWYRK
ncbi:hypothetical protein H7J06_08415 [Mycobacterium hodleri]|uniref:hypothetical protein n=1 Tax=Mycolicibacterium hodleri TaxID=49897 RepID=UPI0021F303A5|nr:hypothetical protein [Mycolicibacterium hodleri]MCV7133011.1 hypothetical protein [Mycolicibacterium hodleri]